MHERENILCKKIQYTSTVVDKISEILYNHKLLLDSLLFVFIFSLCIISLATKL